MKREKNKKDSVLDSYFKKIRNIKPLTLEEERELIKRAKNNDEEAKSKLILTHQGIVVHEASKYYLNNDENFLDLINEGNKGLLIALKRFDLSRNSRFSTYARWWVRNTIINYLSKNQGLMSFPNIFFNDYLKFKRAYNELKKENISDENGNQRIKEPTIEELAERLNVSEKKINIMLSIPEDMISLDKPNYEDSNQRFYSNIADLNVDDPEDILVIKSLENLIHKELEDLSEREVMVLRMKFGLDGYDPMSLRNIASKMGLSVEGVRRIEKRALGKLKMRLKKLGVYGVLN